MKSCSSCRHKVRGREEPMQRDTRQFYNCSKHSFEIGSYETISKMTCDDNTAQKLSVLKKKINFRKINQ